MDLGDQILDLTGFINFPRRLILDYIDALLGEHSVQVRPLRPDDFEDAKRVEAEAWGEQLPQFSREQFETRIGKFPEGNICAVKDDRMLALINTQRMNYDFDRPVPTWNEATNSGYLRHEPDGEYLYGVNLSIARHALLSGAGNLMMLHIGRVMLRSNLKGILLGVRPLRYHRFAHKMTFEEYLWDPTGKLRDPEVGMYCRMGFRVAKALPGYFDDRESCNYGVLLLLENPHRSGHGHVGLQPVGAGAVPK